MKTVYKYQYEKPSTEVIQIETQENIMSTSGFGGGSQEDPGISKGKERKGFWDNSEF